MTKLRTRGSNNSQDSKANAAAKISKARPVYECAQDALHASEILALYEEYGQEIIIVLDKFEVTPWLFYLVACQLDSISQNLVRDEQYSPAELIGDEHWSDLGPEGRREMELCIKHFAAHPEATLIDLKNGTFTIA